MNIEISLIVSILECFIERLIFQRSVLPPVATCFHLDPEMNYIYCWRDVIVRLRQAVVGFEHTQSDHCNVSDLLFPLTDEVLAQRKMRYF